MAPTLAVHYQVAPAFGDGAPQPPRVHRIRPPAPQAWHLAGLVTVQRQAGSEQRPAGIVPVYLAHFVTRRAAHHRPDRESREPGAAHGFTGSTRTESGSNPAPRRVAG